MTFKTILQALRWGQLKFIDVTINFRLFYVKKICLSPNFESYVHIHMEK